MVKSSDGSNRSIDRLGLRAGFLFRINPFVWGISLNVQRIPLSYFSFDFYLLSISRLRLPI